MWRTPEKLRRGFLESTCRGPADRTGASPTAPLLALVPLDSRNPSCCFLPCLIGFQAVIVAGGKARANRQEANPAVAAAVKSGSLNAVRSLASTSKRYDWMTLATTSGNNSSHGTVPRISLPATAWGPVRPPV